MNNDQAQDLRNFLMHLRHEVLVNKVDLHPVFDRHIAVLDEQLPTGEEVPAVEGERRHEPRDPGEHEQELAQKEGLADGSDENDKPAKRGLFGKKKH